MFYFDSAPLDSACIIIYPIVVDLEVSFISQASVLESVRLIITNLGLNPVYTNGPSADPLPVYDPKAL
jgi:hypothetical protein